MPFDLTNTPNTFKRLMTPVLRDCIGHFVIVYFDDILIYSQSLNYHLGHLKQVLFILKKNNLFTNLEKYTFCKENIIFFSFMVGKNGVHVDLEKIKVIQHWSTPKTVREARSFHGLASFYQRFVQDFSMIASPLNKHVKKDITLFG